jgi:LIVCS family branched-chain amino acid:cation transporter
MMNPSKPPSVIVIGLALFAMFFGSGNLIYPMYIGTISQGSWLQATAGFLAAAVLLPFLGVVAMVLYEGCYATFFRTIGRRRGLLLSSLLLTVWIPLGSAPRCITLAYSSLSSYMSMPPLWLFSLLYSALVYLVIIRKVGVLDILGKYITPLLLCCIGVVCWRGMSQAGGEPLPMPDEGSLFLRGLLEGYNTMDLIASFFFSASVIHLLNRSCSNLKMAVSLVLRSGLVGMAILGAVYFSLIALSAQYSDVLETVPKDQMLAHLAQILLGPTWSIFAIVAIVLACFSTSIALVIAYADFLADELFKDPKSQRLPTLAALGVAFVMSLFGLHGITVVTAPILLVCYPVLLVLIVWNIFQALYKKSI